MNPVQKQHRALKLPLSSLLAIFAFALMPIVGKAASWSGFNAQYIQVKARGGNAEFVQVEATTWRGESSREFGGDYFEVRRTSTDIRLQNKKTAEILIFDLAAAILHRKLGNNPSEDGGVIEKVAVANSFTVRGFSVLQNGAKKRQQIDLDQPFTDTGKPSGWRQAVYTAPGITQGKEIPATTGYNLNRVITQQGTTYLRLPDMRFPSSTSPGEFDDIKVWAKYEPFSRSNARQGWEKDFDMMSNPLQLYIEMRRDVWTVTLGDFEKRDVALVTLNLFKKEVEEIGVGNDETANISPEFFPGSGQFRRVSYEVKTDKEINLNRNILKNGALIKAGSIEINLYNNQCTQGGREFWSSEVLLDSYAPRSVTGHSIGSFELKVRNPRSGEIVDALAFVNSRLPLFSMKQVATLEGLAVMPRDAISLRPLVAMSKTRNAITFGDEEFRPAGKLDLTNGQFSPMGRYKDAIIEGPVNYLREFYAGQFKNEVPIPVPSKGPGFQITNKTDFPILISIDQVGCLEHGIIDAGETFSVDTGSVWFTVVASMSPELSDPTDLECATQPLIMAGGIVITGVLSGLTLGAATVPAAMFFGAVGAGTAAGVEAGLIADGMSEDEARLYGAGIMLITAAGYSGAESFVTTVGQDLIQGAEIVATEVAKDALIAYTRTALISAAKSGVKELVLHETTTEELDDLTEQLEQKVSQAGVYAGHTWPWPEEEQTKAIFEVTGGPTKEILPDGKTVVFSLQKQALTLRELPRQ